jgi:hypothetical protein
MAMDILLWLIRDLPGEYRVSAQACGVSDILCHDERRGPDAVGWRP